MPNVDHPIHSIPTRYAGQVFRSRLEARWAVFFDALEIPWEYEPECQFLDGGPYLPDFRLWAQTYVEVKPRLGTLTELWNQYEMLIERVRGMADLLILEGHPKVRWYAAISTLPPYTSFCNFGRSAALGRPVFIPSTRCPPLIDLLPVEQYAAAVEAASLATLLPADAA